MEAGVIAAIPRVKFACFTLGPILTSAVLMMSRVVLILTAFWTIALSGSTHRGELNLGQQLRRLCENVQDVSGCLDEMAAKREAFFRGVVRAGHGTRALEIKNLFLNLMEAEIRFGVDHRLLAAVAITESSLQKGAVSVKGALGLFQIIPTTAESLWTPFLSNLDPKDRLHHMHPVKDAHDARLSILLGSYYLSQLIKSFNGDETLALASYNVGPAKLRKALREGSVPGSGYARKVRMVLQYFVSTEEKAIAASPANKKLKSL